MGELSSVSLYSKISPLVEDQRVFRGVGGDLDKQPTAGVALVQLTGGMQVARSMANRGRQAGANT